MWKNARIRYYLENKLDKHRARKFLFIPKDNEANQFHIKMNVFELKPNQELRFQVGEEPIKLELRRGLAEVYGTEMLANKTYTFSKQTKAAIFTYHGATIEVNGSPMKCHVGQKCDYMICYLTIHSELEKMRVEAERFSESMKFSSSSENNSSVTIPINPDSPSSSPDLRKTPVCLVCKPMYARNVGKSTLCRILLNYATRRGWTPIFVDLDPDVGSIGLPGTVGALSIESPIDIETGLSLRSSMLMHFGHTSVSAEEGKSDLLYQELVKNMAQIVNSKLEQDRKSYYSGVIINTSDWSDDNGYKLLIHACKAFHVNMVLVMDDEVLQDDLRKDLEKQCSHPITVVSVPKTVGIVTRMPESNVELRLRRIKEYFYGTPSEPLNPMRSDIKFSFLRRLIYHIGNPLMLPDSLMPLGTKIKSGQIKVTHYDCKPSDLLHHILSISFCRIDDILENSDVILQKNIMGFICITNVDNDIVSILTPQKIPNPMDYVLLFSSVQYMDSLI